MKAENFIAGLVNGMRIDAQHFGEGFFVNMHVSIPSIPPSSYVLYLTVSYESNT